MHKITVKHFFDAAHDLPNSEYLVTKECSRLHGHTYAVEVICGSENLQGGMVVDFKGIKNIIDILDHRYVNTVFREQNFECETTAENIARFLFYKIQKSYPDLHIFSVAVCEGYKGAEKASWVHYYGSSV